MPRRYIAQVVHYPTPPGTEPVFFFQSRFEGDPQECQRLVPLAADQLEPLIRSIEAAAKSARAHVDAQRGEMLAANVLHFAPVGGHA